MFTTEAADRHIAATSFSYEDPYRLLFHAMPLTGWMNDPNGLVYYNGQYHAFYQANPYSTDSTAIKHWGHMASPNLIDWTHLPTAMAPDEPYDRQGCYSGSAIEKEGLLYLIYTGNVRDNYPKQLQCIAESKDGINFSKSEKNPLFGPPGENDDFRDPFVWRHDGGYYCLIGTHMDNKGCVRLYQSDDLFSWRDCGTMLDSDGTQGTMWEMPCLLRIDDTDILILSVMNREGIPHSTIYYTGAFDYKTGKFTPATCRALDFGSEFYAPQILKHKDRYVLIAWMDQWELSTPTMEYGWAGALTVPRELSVNDGGYLCANPVAELNQYRREVYHTCDYILRFGSENPLCDIRAVAFDIEFKIDLDRSEGKRLEIGVRGDNASKEETTILFDMENGFICVDETRSGVGQSKTCTTEINPLCFNEQLSVRILVDRSSLEIFLQNGATVITNRIYPQLSSEAIRINVLDKAMFFRELSCFIIEKQ